jgi:hypothetical protein
VREDNRSSWRELALAVLAVPLIFMATSAAFKNHIDGVAAWSIRFAQSHPFQGATIFVLSSAVSAMLAFGSAHYPFGKFIIAIGFAEAIYAYTLVVVGERLLAMRPSVVFIGILIVGAVAVASLIRTPKR